MACDAVLRRLPGPKSESVGPAPFSEWVLEQLAFRVGGRWVGDVATAFGADYIHAHFSHTTTTAAWSASLASGIPFGFTAHAIDIFRYRNAWLREKAAAAALAVTIADFHKQLLVEHLGGSIGDRFQVVRCGIDPTTFVPTDEPPIHDIAAVGRLIEKKGFDVLIRALALIPEPRPTCRIVGDGPLRTKLAELVASLGLGDTVQLLGALPRERVREVVARSRLFVLPCQIASDGDRDGLPVSLIEALALAKPTISTPVSGIPELIEDGRTGLLVSAGSADELATAITHLLQSPLVARRLGAAGRVRVAALYDLRVNAARLATLMHERISERAVHSGDHRLSTPDGLTWISHRQ